MKTAKRFFIPFIFLAFLTFVGCEKQHDVESIKSQVNTINESLVKAILADDDESIFKLYTQDAISLPSYEPMIKGLDAMKAHAAAKKDMQGKMKSFVITSTDVWVNGNFIIDIGTYSMSMETGDSTMPEWNDNGKYLTVFEIQKDGSLLTKAETWNTDINPWEEMKKAMPQTTE